MLFAGSVTRAPPTALQVTQPALSEVGNVASGAAGGPTPTFLNVRLRNVSHAVARAVGPTFVVSAATLRAPARWHPEPAASATPNARSCETSPGRTLVRNREVRVVQRDLRSYACQRPDGRRRALGDRPSLGDTDFGFLLTRLRVAGRFVAYSLRYDSVCAVASVELLDLRRGQGLRPASFGSRFSDDCPTDARVTDVELRSTGALAWIVRLRDTGGPGFRPARYELRTRGRGAPLREDGRLIDDTLTGRDAASLRLRGSTLSWTSRGELRTRTLR